MWGMSFPTRGWTHVPWVQRWVLNHRPPRTSLFGLYCSFRTLFYGVHCLLFCFNLFFLPGESQGRRSLVGCLLCGRRMDTTEATQQQHIHEFKSLQISDLYTQWSNILVYLKFHRHSQLSMFKSEPVFSPIHQSSSLCISCSCSFIQKFFKMLLYIYYLVSPRNS